MEIQRKACRRTITVRDMQRMTGLGRTSIYKLIRKNEIDTVRIGRRRLIIEESLDALISRSTVKEGIKNG